MPKEDFKDWWQQKTDKASSLGIDTESTLWLLRRHGKHIDQIFQSIEQDQPLAQRITATVPLIVADLLFCLKHEMVCHLEDLLRRRLPLLILYRMTKTELIQFAEISAKTLGWDQNKLDKEVEFCVQKWLLN